MRYSMLLALLMLPFQAYAGQPDEVEVTFRSSPAGATVSVDGQEKCETECKLNLYKGAHVIGMELDGHEAHEEIVEFKKRRTVKWKLVGYDGTLDVGSVPEGLRVTVTKKGVRKQGKRRKTPITGLSLRPGTYVVKLAEKDYEADDMEVVVTAGQGTVAELEPVFVRASLSITITDDEDEGRGVKVLANGKRLKGKGPWTLKPGAKRIVVKKGRRTLLEQQVVLDKGASVELDVSVQEE